MVSESSVGTAVRDWVRATLPELAAGYDHEVFGKTALPDVVVILLTSSVEVGLDEFPLSRLQQTYVEVYRMNVSVMVDNEQPVEADAALKDFAHRLRTEAL